ncbi:Pr6Pr family membrane protein [Bifidobacterium gallicum]|uniref:Membrane protein n=1 Tax=Bifidobacterium gallicum DSM 20093 = LMG 11596 TaxID=561180 RepID=D1NUL3_9BIFI|nr:Pr6Pr family membrane protein [Bifidobacterium gallicum]EFA22514.1 hypothetical protein BIFGAL_03538 [Bifidobacterium gallicum DSM 20093 = LMG 11596]KFI59508.1 membrane protein [Bifidobacterium gallicum DSM 20093 = LMG 11596]
MSTNRTAQLIVQSMYVALGVVAIFGSFGLYDADFDGTFYTYFTNLSNYLCVGVMFAELVQTARRKGNGFVTLSPLLKFICVIAIMLTCCVFNFILAGAPDRDPLDNYKVTCILFHTVLPLLFVADWLAFYRHGVVKWTFPLISTIFPLLFVAFVFIRAAIFPSAENLYPYFFLDPGQQGVDGVIRWIVILLITFIAFGYLLMALDRALDRRSATVATSLKAAALD